jgi:hypothetical protein
LKAIIPFNPVISSLNSSLNIAEAISVACALKAGVIASQFQKLAIHSITEGSLFIYKVSKLIISVIQAVFASMLCRYRAAAWLYFSAKRAPKLLFGCDCITNAIMSKLLI